MNWIECSEQLPTPGERVIATNGGFVGEGYVNKLGEWFRYHSTGAEYGFPDSHRYPVTHWQPMPAAQGQKGGER